jgi:hypothetical protein
MKHIAFALVVVSSVAGAQGQPFNFTESFPSTTKLQAILQYSSGYGNAFGAEQSGEVDVPIGSRVVVMATTDVAYERFGSFEGAGQLEAMVDALRFGGWHLSLSAGLRRHYDGSDMALGRLSISRTTDKWSVAANADAVQVFSGHETMSPYRTQYFGSLASTAKVAPGLSVGLETFASEGRAATIFAGPLVSFALPGGRARLDLSGGPIICTAGNCALAPDYTIVGKYAMPLPVHNTGYTLRLAVSVGLF